MLGAEIGVPYGLDQLAQIIEDFLNPAPHQWICRHGGGFFQGQASGNDPLGDLGIKIGAGVVPAEGRFVGGSRHVRTPERA